MSDSHIPYQECIEGCAFIIMGRLYDKKYEQFSFDDIKKIESLPFEYKEETVFDDAIKHLLGEEFITGQKIITLQFAPILLLLFPRMTQKGCEWYQYQIKKNKPKWKKFLTYVGKKVLDKTINSIGL